MENSPAKKIVINISLVILLGVCLWLGWSDKEFIFTDMNQDEIRESIRAYIRTGIQYAVQYLIPLAIITYFGRKIFSQDSDA